MLLNPHTCCLLSNPHPPTLSLPEQVEYPNGTKTLVMIPSKYQKKLWIRRGSYVIVDDLASEEAGDTKVTGMIAAVLFPGK